MTANMDPGTPSYARPTQASRNHQAALDRTQNYRKPTTAYRSDQRSRATKSSLRWETYRSYSAPTVASVRRSSHTRPFRFFDLPPELRNKVYEYLSIARVRHWVDLGDPALESPVKALPRILQVSRRVRDEAGSYYFRPNVQFNLILDTKRPSLLKRWLNIIGPLNRVRLASNPEVHVRFRATWDLPTHHATDIVQTFTMQHSIDAIKPDHAFSSCGEDIPMVMAWQFSRTSPGSLMRWRQAPRSDPSSFYVISFHRRDLEKLKDIVVAIVEALSKHRMLTEE